jgi:ferredoxin-NADP reductase/ferredoxin
MAALLVSHHRPGFYMRVLEEGEVGTGDEITKVADGPERVTITEIDALLYLPGHPRDQLERSLRIPALSPGWKSSLQALSAQAVSGTQSMGNSGLTGATSPPPSWPGFRSLRIARLDRESATVTSVVFETTDGSRLPPAMPGQFLVLKIRLAPDTPPILRNYSISSAPDSGVYRVSIKREVNGVASAFLCDHARTGDALEVSAPRGSFTLQAGEGPVVLLSAGIGATPVLAMLHALATMASPREVWWLYGARDHANHPFVQESRTLVDALSHGRSYILYSRPGPDDRLGKDYDAPGHWSVHLIAQLEVPRNADFYLCGPATFLRTLTTDLRAWGVTPGHIHQEIFGPTESLEPGVVGAAARTPHLPAGKPVTGPQVFFTRSGLAVPWDSSFQSLLELAEACDVAVKWSCRTGVCHTCESALIGGAVSYSPEPLEPPGEGNVLICCSRPQGDIELDL